MWISLGYYNKKGSHIWRIMWAETNLTCITLTMVVIDIFMFDFIYFIELYLHLFTFEYHFLPEKISSDLPLQYCFEFLCYLTACDNWFVPVHTLDYFIDYLLNFCLIFLIQYDEFLLYWLYNIWNYVYEEYINQ